MLLYSAPIFAWGGTSESASAAGRYNTHIYISGGGGGHSAARKPSLSIQLSAADSYSGGRLQVGSKETGWSAPREPGAAILFPSFVSHRVTPLVSGI